MRALLWAATIASIVAAAANTSDADPTRGRPGAAPRLLSQTGLYEAGTLDVDPANRPYSPQYPLWTDGASKRRWVRLPGNTSIEARDPRRWDFPVGTKFWKEFAFSGRRIETRLIWKARPDVWVFASYAWNSEQTDAALVSASGLRNVADIATGKRHSIPSVDDCHACHDSNRVLGFNALQLSTDRDPLAPHAEPLEAGMVTMTSLLEEQRFKPNRMEPVAQPARVDAPTPVARAALGYLATNCGICHREGAAIDTRLRLTADVDGSAAVLNLLRSAPVTWEIPSAGEGTTRFLVPGHPERSSIVARMKSRRPSTQMPPLGTVMVDRQAVELIEKWIEELGTNESAKIDVRSSR